MFFSLPKEILIWIYKSIFTVLKFKFIPIEYVGMFHLIG